MKWSSISQFSPVGPYGPVPDRTVLGKDHTVRSQKWSPFIHMNRTKPNGLVYKKSLETEPF